MKKKMVSLLLAAVFIIGALSGCGNKSESASKTQDTKTSEGELKVLRAAVMTGQLDQYATEIGLWKGIFKKYGIDLQTTEFVAGVNTIDSVVTGTADVGMMSDYAVVNRFGNTLEETDLKIFSELSGAGAKNGGLYVAPEYADNLEKLDGSKGFMTVAGTVYDYYASQAFNYLGFDETKQNLINTDSSQTQLALVKSGDASAIVALGSSGIYFEQYGWKLAVKSEDMGIETGTYLLAKENFIAENKELLSNYLKALAESVQYVDANIDESAEYLADKLGIKAEDFKLQWQTYQIKTGFSEEAGVHLEEISKWAFEHEKYPKEYNIRDFIDTSVVESAFPENVTIKK